jgi:hypothetical protein
MTTSKVLSMNFPVADYTQRKTVADIKAVLWVLRPRLDMVCMYWTAFAALLTGVFVALVDGCAPVFQLRAKTGTFVRQGYTALPVGGQWSYFRLAGATSRAKGLSAEPRSEGVATECTCTVLRWMTLRPTFFRAVSGAFRSVYMLLILSAAYVAGKHYSTAAILSSDDGGAILGAKLLLLIVGLVFLPAALTDMFARVSGCLKMVIQRCDLFGTDFWCLPLLSNSTASAHTLTDGLRTIADWTGPMTGSAHLSVEVDRSFATLTRVSVHFILSQCSKPLYHMCDVILRRWEAETGAVAVRIELPTTQQALS